MKENERVSDFGELSRVARRRFSVLFLCLLLAVGNAGCVDAFFAPVNGTAGDEKVIYRVMEIFPLVEQHVHGSTVVEPPNGNLLAAWSQGSGERWAEQRNSVLESAVDIYKRNKPLPIS